MADHCTRLGRLRKPNPNPNDKVDHVAHVVDRHAALKSKVDQISKTNPWLRNDLTQL